MTSLLICVNYNSRQETIRFVKSLFQVVKGGNKLSILIVDNSDVEAEKVKDLASIITVNDTSILSIDYIEPSVNLGYFGGAQYGLDFYLKSKPLPELVILSNVDLFFVQDDFFQKLDEQKINYEIGCISPSILSSTNVAQNPYQSYRPSKISILIKCWIYKYYFTYQVYELLFKLKSSIYAVVSKNSNNKENHKFSIDESPSANQIYATHGSCFILTKSYFEKGGNFTYPCFLYGEEFFIAEELRRLGLTTIYNPNLKLIHHGQVSTGKMTTRTKQEQIIKSLSYIISTYF
jgi:GT2 family glycosyltransferase